jgi:dihydropteroate synthase
VQHRLWGVRVHDVVAAVDAVDVAEQLWGSERHE